MTRIKLLGALFLLAASLVSTAPGKVWAEGGASAVAASEFDRARELYRQYKYDEVLAIIRPLAEQGHAEAQALLSSMYYLGYGVLKDRCLSTVWKDRAARQGHSRAQAQLGRAYWAGTGVIRDHEKAYLWLMTANMNGDANAKATLESLAKSELTTSKQKKLDVKLRNWRPEHQPPVHIIRTPYIWGISEIILLAFGLTACDYP